MVEPTSGVLCAIIAQPEKIVHKVCWTKKDVEGAKRIRQVFPGAVWAHKKRNGTMEIGSKEEMWCNDASGDLLPSLRTGAVVNLDEILKSEKKTNSRTDLRWTEKNYGDAI